MEKEKIIIDCDPGSDDALAIILALYSGKLDLKAVCSVTGNGALDTTTRNGLNILSLCGREDIPLYRGSAVALDQKQPETVSAFGDDGLGGFAHTIASNKKEEDQNAVDFLVEYVNGHPKEITLFAIGPCTNIAHAIRKSPDFAGNLKRLIIMGGAKYTGNMSPVAEYNFWADPMAAHEVLMSGIQDVTMIGLDVTNKIALDGSMREILRIGVILVGALAGPLPAAVTGVLTNLINGIFDPTWIPYAFCAFFIGISSGLLSKYNMMTKVWKLVISGIIIALVGTITATPITVFFFGGATGGGASMLAAGLMATGKQILESVLSVYIVTESVGKLISVFIAYFIIKAIPERSLVKYKYGEKFIKTKSN